MALSEIKGDNRPLTIWYCDFCKEPIEDVNNCYVIWKCTEKGAYYSFKIIHSVKCDQREVYDRSLPIKEFLGIDGITNLLSFLSLGPIISNLSSGGFQQIHDFDDFVDFFRRVQIPYYEEARRKFNNQKLLSDFIDANEVFPYTQEGLKKISNDY